MIKAFIEESGIITSINRIDLRCNIYTGGVQNKGVPQARCAYAHLVTITGPPKVACRWRHQ
jgi:hypothetical protein